jgi:hypothetical protein
MKDIIQIWKKFEKLKRDCGSGTNQLDDGILVRKPYWKLTSLTEVNAEWVQRKKKRSAVLTITFALKAKHQNRNCVIARRISS